MQMTVSNNIVVTEPSAELIKWCQDNLIISNPEYVRKARMGLWLGDTPKRLYLYEMRGGELVLPFGTLRDIWQFTKGASVKSKFSDATEINYKTDVPLYPYQEKAVTQALIGKYGILESKAGSGKTQMGIAILTRYGRRALWLTHTLDLLKQSKARAEQYIDPSLIGTISEGKVNIGKGVTFATVQTMCQLDLASFKDIWDVIIVDECHRVAGTPLAVTQFSKVLNSLSARHKYGLSATIHRADGMIVTTKALLGDVVYSVPDKDVADRVMKVGVKPIDTNTVVSSMCLNTDGTLNYAKLINYLVADATRNRVIADCIVKEANRSCLILSDRLSHLSELMKKLPPEMQEKAAMIDGSMTSKKGKLEREQAIEDMRTGKKKYLFASYKLAKEGLDIPCLERLFMTTPQTDYTTITQSIGRIARVFKGKADPICYDFVDNIGYCWKSYKKRCTTYKKNDCYFVEQGD